MTKTDLVAHNIVGAPPKVFTEQDARPCDVTEDGDIRWVGWQHNFNIGVNMDLCNEIFDEGLKIDVWETKDRVSSRARFDKPKPPGAEKPHASSASDGAGGAGGQQPSGNSKSNLRQGRKSKRASVVPRDRTSGRTSTQFGNRSKSPGSSGGRGSVVAGGQGSTGGNSSSSSSSSRRGKHRRNSNDDDDDDDDRDHHAAFGTPPSTTSGGGGGGGTELGGATVELGLLGSDEPEGPTIADKIMTNTVSRSARGGANAVDKDAQGTKVHVSLTDFFAGDRKVVYLLEDASAIGLNKIKQVRVTVEIDRPMLSDKYARTLNPLVLKFLDTRAMPETPVSFAELDRKCKQSAVEFAAFRGGRRRIVSEDKRHGERQVWDQKYVVLTNRYSFEEMVRYLKEPIPIEVHDRDRQAQTGLPTTALFDSTKPELFNDFWMAVGHTKTANVLQDLPEQWDPYGVAKLDLADLLSGVKTAEYEIPILSGPRMSGLKATDASVGAMHAGHYVEKGASLTVNVSLFRPVTSVQSRMSYVAAPSGRASVVVQSRMHRSFGRAAFLWNGPHHEFFDRLKDFVDRSNVETLKLDTLALADLGVALQSYELTLEQQRDGDLDILTGFQLATPNMRVAVVEGLSAGKLAELHNVVGHPTDPGFRSLFDSSENFLERLYGPLGPSLASVFIAESLGELGERSEIYVKGGRGWGCLTGLSQIQALFVAPQMKVATRDDLLPSSTSISTIRRAYGEAPTSAMLPPAAAGVAGGGGDISATIPMSNLRMTNDNLRATVKNATARITTTNSEYDTMLATQRHEPDRNFLAKNTATIAGISAANTILASERRRLNETITQHGGTAVHNYSTSTFNSSVLAQERMQEMIHDDIRAGRRPKALYTYDVTGEFHHSAAAAVMAPDAPGPGQMDAAATLKRRDAPEKWLTGRGLDTTARNVVDLSRQHADPDTSFEAKQFNEVLGTGRGVFPWELREKDFDNLTRKPANTHAVAEYGLLDQTARQATVAVVGGTTKPRRDVGGGPRWKSTPLSREPASVPRSILEPYNDAGVARNAMGDGSLLHATMTSTVPIDVTGPRLALVHNTRTSESVGRHFHKNRK